MVESGGLENRCGATHRGFESYLLRHKNKNLLTGRVFMAEHWSFNSNVQHFFGKSLKNKLFIFFLRNIEEKAGSAS